MIGNRVIHDTLKKMLASSSVRLTGMSSTGTFLKGIHPEDAAEVRESLQHPDPALLLRGPHHHQLCLMSLLGFYLGHKIREFIINLQYLILYVYI